MRHVAPLLEKGLPFLDQIRVEARIQMPEDSMAEKIEKPERLRRVSPRQAYSGVVLHVMAVLLVRECTLPPPPLQPGRWCLVVTQPYGVIPEGDPIPQRQF